MMNFTVVNLIKKLRYSHEINSKFVCYTLDWWPNEKCDWGNCSWVDTSVNKLRFDDTLLVNAAKKLKGRIRVGGTLRRVFKLVLLISSDFKRWN